MSSTKFSEDIVPLSAPFLRGVVKGLMDLEEGRELDLSTVKKRLGLS